MLKYMQSISKKYATHNAYIMLIIIVYTEIKLINLFTRTYTLERDLSVFL